MSLSVCALAGNARRKVKLTGDGAHIEFPSAVDALAAAIEFQQMMLKANRGQPEDMAIVFRIGIHLGDLIVEGDDLYGGAVNITARLQERAPAGGILVSRTVKEAVAGRMKATFEDRGRLELKNIERPVPAFRVIWDPGDVLVPLVRLGRQSRETLKHGVANHLAAMLAHCILWRPGLDLF